MHYLFSLRHTLLKKLLIYKKAYCYQGIRDVLFLSGFYSKEYMHAVTFIPNTVSMQKPEWEASGYNHACSRGP
jgi:hypothetical protein